MSERKDFERERSRRRLQCNALSDQGKRCRKLTYRLAAFHGDPESRAIGVMDSTAWVQVALCDLHHPNPAPVSRKAQAATS